ncbi:MAG: EcsC family protein [Lysobacter sp.]|nr:EcsC family protein [Lysobacter sp.]
MSDPEVVALSPAEMDDLRRAVTLLESPSLAMRIASLVGSPVESLIKRLPRAVSSRLHGAVESALTKAAEAALWSMDNAPGKPASTRLHKLAAAGTGAVGGAFGFGGLFVELPVATTMMMRSVADVARSEGFDLRDFATKQACLEVFAFGGNTAADDAGDVGYYAVRGFTADAMRHLSKELAQIAAKNGGVMAPGVTSKQAAKWLAAAIEKIAARFGVVVSEKFAAQAVPVIGAVTGAALNTMFVDYYQDVARGHFIVKRLEAKYGVARIEALYRQQLVAGKKALPAPKP